MNVLSLIMITAAIGFFLLKVESWPKRILGVIAVSITSSAITFALERTVGPNLLTREIDSFLVLIILSVVIGLVIGLIDNSYSK